MMMFCSTFPVCGKIVETKTAECKFAKKGRRKEGKSHSLATTTEDSTGCKYSAIKPKKYAFFHYNSLNNAIKLSS